LRGWLRRGGCRQRLEHLREESFKNVFACGVGLNRLEVVGTQEDWHEDKESTWALWLSPESRAVTG
jgi:hypothetical protein